MVDITSLSAELYSRETDSYFETSKSELGKEVSKKDYINRINYANFENIPLIVLFKHKIFGRTLSLQALPDPYIDNNLDLTWFQCIPENEDLSQFNCEKILIPNFGQYLVVSAEEYLITSDGISLTLPDSAYELTNRKRLREDATDIEATIIQNGSLFEGCLKDFNSDGFLVLINKKRNDNLKLLNRDETLSVLMKKGDSLLFSGICHVVLKRDINGNIEFVLVPINSNFKRFRAKEYRGERYTLRSPLHVSFIHPLSGKLNQLKVSDLSGSGFSLMENQDNAFLFAGLVIPEIRFLLPGNNYLSCRAQVIYSNREEESDQVTCGLVILDMNPLQYSRLLDFIHHDLDDRANVCNDVDMRALWGFFFESGFIYPQKYKYITRNKEKIKELYRKLYTEQPAIARHFIYQKENHIQGHMSMIRSYENSWLLHHHAASTISSQNSGLHVLNQVGSFTNNSHRIASMHMNYLMCYFRKENKFPNRVFGGLADKINEKKKCSLDDWGYYHFDKEREVAEIDESEWSVSLVTPGELKDLKCLYEYQSGGLMLQALNIEEGYFEENTIVDEYIDSGFSRDIRLYSLKRDQSTCAMIMIDQSEAGLNMSDLTNSFKIFITDPASLTKNILDSVLMKFSEVFSDENRIPVLIYPHSQALEINIPIEKIYTLWVLNMEATDSYFHYLKKLLRNIRH